MISDHRIIDSTPSTISRVTGPPACGGRYRLAEGVERACADVAVDDADAAERQRPELRPFMTGCSGGGGVPFFSLQGVRFGVHGSAVRPGTRRESAPIHDWPVRGNMVRADRFRGA